MSRDHLPQARSKLKDVAAKAGVSAMTVSLVMRGGLHGDRISHSTRERVVRAAQELNYQPNARARALRSGRTNMIAFYQGKGCLNLKQPFFADILGGIQDGCEEVRKDLLLHGVFRGGTPDEIFSELADGRIDGLIAFMDTDDPLAKKLAAARLPVVTAADALPGIPSIVADDVMGSRLIVEHLTEKGYRKVYYATTPAVHTSSAAIRLKAFLETAANHGLEVEVGYPTEREFAQILLSRFRSQTSAIVCWNDDMARTIQEVCLDIGLAVPKFVGIVGFDGCPVPYRDPMPLTTVRAPWAEVGRQAVRHLNALIDGKEIPSETVLPVRLIRGSTT